LGKVVIRAHGVSPEIYEEMKQAGLSIEDATCPYVKKIHKLVEEKYGECFQIIIIGDRNHPEVKGINGWCHYTAKILDSVEEAESLEIAGKKLCVVAQTTITKEKWENINDSLKKRFENIIKFDTICSATSLRQKEAEDIAGVVDLMLVVGGKNSSNTQKLYDICKKYCECTYKVETSGDLPPVNIKNIKKIGITAGASTPEKVIKEVIKQMSELDKQETEMSFKDAFESSLVTLQSGEVVKGTIIGYNNNEVYVDLGFKSDGVIKMEEFTDDPDFKPEEVIKPGDEIEVFIVRVNDGEGNVQLSKKKVDVMKNWSKVEQSYENKTPLQAKVIDVVNGGVIASAGGVRIFVPASQLSDRFVKDLKEFLKQTLTVRIVEYNKQKRKLVGSARVILEEEKASSANEVWGTIEAGRKYSGTVKNLMDFGAFVDIGGVDGLIHLSELSWSKIKHPSEVLKVGDKVEVTVLDFDRDKKRISLGYRKTEDNPWNIASEKYKVGDVIKGKVVRIVPFGAFVEIEKGVDGLVHISQISNVRIAKPSDVLEIGQEIEAKVTEFNLEARKIGLSIKEVNPIDPVPANVEEKAGQEPANPEDVIPSEHKEDIGNTIGEVLGNVTVEE
jgi:small subunit ribosomal protein S1